MPYKGIVKGNAIIFEEPAPLPEGLKVAVTLEPEGQLEGMELTSEEIKVRQAVVASMKEFGKRLAGRNVNLGDLILEAREELEHRA